MLAAAAVRSTKKQQDAAGSAKAVEDPPGTRFIVLSGGRVAGLAGRIVRQVVPRLWPFTRLPRLGYPSEPQLGTPSRRASGPWFLPPCTRPSREGYGGVSGREETLFPPSTPIIARFVPICTMEDIGTKDD